jgi:hypothetical protein
MEELPVVEGRTGDTSVMWCDEFPDIPRYRKQSSFLLVHYAANKAAPRIIAAVAVFSIGGSIKSRPAQEAYGLSNGGAVGRGGAQALFSPGSSKCGAWTEGELNDVSLEFALVATCAGRPNNVSFFRMPPSALLDSSFSCRAVFLPPPLSRRLGVLPARRQHVLVCLSRHEGSQWSSVGPFQGQVQMMTYHRWKSKERKYPF